MSGYILSILGIVIIGIIIDIIIPGGAINKFIKSVYGIFVVLVIASPIIKFFKNYNDYQFTYNEYTIDSALLNYINNMKVSAMEDEIKLRLKNEGLHEVGIKINFSQELDNLQLNSCYVDLKNLSSSSVEVNNNRYAIITTVVKEITNLSEEVIIFYE